ncbi:MAG: NUDIX domain-containing protein [Aquihabitans sp.]
MSNAPERVGLTVDVVILTIRDGHLSVLLVERGIEPYKGSWALPGGFVLADEDLAAAARRELSEETALSAFDGHLEQLATYAAPGRDPRMRVASVAHLGFVPDLPAPTAGSDAAGAKWWAVDDLDLSGSPTPTIAGAAGTHSAQLAFDHHRIVTDAVERARSKLEYTTLAAEFVTEPFTLGDLRLVYEAVWGVDLDPANFRRKVRSTEGFVTETGTTVSVGRGRPAVLYRRGPATALQPAMLRPEQ